jgi:hypothetical protein
MLAERGTFASHTPIMRWVLLDVPEYERCRTRYATRVFVENVTRTAAGEQRAAGELTAPHEKLVKQQIRNATVGWG